MSIHGDRGISEQAVLYRTIEPFSEGQVDAPVISGWPASNGYDLRVSGEFKVLTHVKSAAVAPEAFNQRSFLSVQGGWGIVQPNSIALARSIEHFRIPGDVSAICVGKPTYARCGVIRKRNAIRAGVGGLYQPRDIKRHSPAGQGLCQRRAVPDSVLSAARSPARSAPLTARQVPGTTGNRVAQAGAACAGKTKTGWIGLRRR